MEIKNSVSSEGEYHKPPEKLQLQNLNIDHLLKTSVGGFGLWQFMVAGLIIIGTPSTPTFPIFANSIPLKRCYMGEEVEQTLTREGLQFEEAAAIIGPWKLRGDEERTTQNGCTRYKVKWSNETLKDWIKSMKRSDFKLNYTTSVESCSDGYVYAFNKLQYSSSVVADFKTVCERSWLVPLGTSVYMFGMMFGFILGGWAGDKFGRKKASICMSLLELVAAISTSYAHNFVVYVVSRAIIGAANSGKITVFNVLIVEITLAQYRSYFSALMFLGYNFLLRSLISLCAYYITDWRWLHFAVMAPSAFCILHIFLLPESPRWLLSQNRKLDALKCLRFGCRVNSLCGCTKTNMTSLELLIHAHRDVSEMDSSAAQTSEKSSPRERKSRMIFQAFSTPQMRKLTVSGIFIFTAYTMTFFGLLLYARLVRGHICLVSFVNAAITIPAIAISSVLYCIVSHRKLPLIGAYTIAVVMLMIGGLYTFLSKTNSDIVLSITSNLALMCCLSAGFMLFIYIPELYPCVIRSQGLGLVAGVGRIGGMLATFVNELDVILGHGIPLVVFAAFICVAICLLMLLPDTSGVNLCEYLDADKKKTEQECDVNQEKSV